MLPAPEPDPVVAVLSKSVSESHADLWQSTYEVTTPPVVDVTVVVADAEVVSVVV